MYRIVLSGLAAGVTGLAAFSQSGPSTDGGAGGDVSTSAVAQSSLDVAGKGGAWATDFTTVGEVRRWCTDGRFHFVKEVDTCAADSDKGIPKVDLPAPAPGVPVPPTQLQVWRLGTDAAADFPAFTVREFLERFRFPLGAFAGNAAATSGKKGSDSDEDHQNQSLAPSPLLRLVVFVPNASTRRVMSEVTDPSRRKMWDTNYKEFVVLQEHRLAKAAAATDDADEDDKKWRAVAASQECRQKENLVESNIVSHDPQVQALLRDRDYMAMQRRRFRSIAAGNDDDISAAGFELEYSRWTFHRIYSSMTAAFGMKPRVSYLERIYGARRVVVPQQPKPKSYSILTAIDASLSLPKELPEGSKPQTAEESAALQRSERIASSQALHDAAWRVARAAHIPVRGDVPVYNHIQELLLFPLPAGCTDKQIAALMEQTGRDDMSPRLIRFYEREWLPQIEPLRAGADAVAVAAASKERRLPHDGVLMSFTTANSTGIIGYPRWFERYIQKLFSTHAMGSLIAQVANHDRQH